MRCRHHRITQSTAVYERCSTCHGIAIKFNTRFHPQHRNAFTLGILDSAVGRHPNPGPLMLHPLAVLPLVFGAVHERHRGSDSYWHPFFEAFASNPAYASFVNHQDNEAERSYFQAQVLPILDPFLSNSSLDLEHLRSIDTFAWATSLLSTHGGFWPVGSITCASLAALAARLSTHPLDTIKTRIQSIKGHSTIYGTFQSIWKQQGPRGLYRGLPVALVFSVPALSAYLFLYDQTKAQLSGTLLGNSDSVSVHATSALIAECVSGLFWTPMEVLKNRQQSGSKSRVFGLVKEIYRTNGLFGFFRGYFLGLGVFVPYTMVYFITYEKFKNVAGQWMSLRKPEAFIETEHLPFWAYLICSSTSGALAAGASNIFDGVKTRIQIGGEKPWTLIKDMWKTEGGVKAFTKGMGARILWITPSVTISMTFYETLRANFIF